MQTDLEARWDALSSDPERSIFQLYDAHHPLLFYIGRGANGARLLLLITAEKPPPVQNLRSISLRSYKRDDGNWSMLLSLENDNLSSVFSLLCSDLIVSSDLPDVNANLPTVLKRLSNWRRLLDRGGQNLLTEGQIRGLFAELTFLKTLMKDLGSLQALNAWGGPEGSDQDFQTAEAAWEIKSIRPENKSVEIASENQLFSICRKIELVVIELIDYPDEKQGAESLNNLVRKLQKFLSHDMNAIDLLENRLASAGYCSRAEYDTPLLKASMVRRFDVQDKFPRVTPDMLQNGISRLTYQVSLAECEPFLIQ